jgi:hypothetical protein
MSGNFAEAQSAAQKLVGNVRPHAKKMPMVEAFFPTPYLVLIAFERWPDILKLPAPDRALIYTTAQWHFARSMALAALGKTDQAQDESKAFLTGLGKLPPDASLDPLNSVANVARVQENLLAGMIEHSRGDANETDEMLEGFQRAIAAEDALNYSEPPSWFPPVRPMLGQVLLEMKRPADAEKVFRAALDKFPRYPRALAGLLDSLKAQNRTTEVQQIEQQLREAQGKIDAVSSVRAKR